MKKILLFAIHLYQVIFSPLMKNVIGVSSVCRFSPSCSTYAKESIEKHGIFRGSYLSLIRLSQCQPFS